MPMPAALERKFASTVLLAAVAFGAAAQQHAPRVLVDSGACPFECCRYGRWTSTGTTPAFTSPAATHAARTIPAGSTVTAITGYVRTVGRPFVVSRRHGSYKPGDKLMVYTYYGEGEFAVWHRGRRFTEDLGFSPYGGAGGKRCTDRTYCWGTLSRDLSADWWVQVRLDDGKIYWIHDPHAFEGQDACA